MMLSLLLCWSGLLSLNWFYGDGNYFVDVIFELVSLNISHMLIIYIKSV